MPTKYPQRKTRDLLVQEKSAIREQFDRGEDNVYTLAAEHDCSPSQIAGMKARRSR